MAYSTDWQIVDPVIGSQPITEASTEKRHELGTVVKAVDKGSNANGEGQFIYVKGVSSGAVGSWVKILEDDYSTALLAANDIGKVGILMAALDANTKYGWAQVRGKAVGKCLAAFADNGLVYATATAGSIDDAVVAGDRVKQAIGASAIDGPATGMAEFEIDHPFMDDGTAA
jgi:hypothetical protein